MIMSGDQSKVIVVRPDDDHDKVRKYKILIDGELKGNIGLDSTVVIDVAPGDHALQLKIDWGASDMINFSIDPREILEFHCGNNIAISGLNPYRSSLHFSFKGRKKYLWIKQISRKIESIK